MVHINNNVEGVSGGYQPHYPPPPPQNSAFPVNGDPPAAVHVHVNQSYTQQPGMRYTSRCPFSLTGLIVVYVGLKNWCLIIESTIPFILNIRFICGYGLVLNIRPISNFFL